MPLGKIKKTEFKNSEKNFTEQGINLQVFVPSYEACTSLVPCFAVVQRKHRVEGQISRLHDD